jgi:hypothetical protein
MTDPATLSVRPRASNRVFEQLDPGARCARRGNESRVPGERRETRDPGHNVTALVSACSRTECASRFLAKRNQGGVLRRGAWQNETTRRLGQRSALAKQNQTKRYRRAAEVYASPISRRISALCSPNRGEGRGDATGLPPIMIGVRTPGILPSLAAALASSKRIPRCTTCGSAKT